ncbi:AraC family transcriptional regulator [Aeromonas salmonicida subsp. salmonicida]|nr:helix-turn-helix domain-containing protein [Aeromonas salmonicida subsp. salmonicida]QHE49753.1 helix-turn-helix domain-containing protein [Aeromonas salmonicida subsp. salmonicida]QJF57769.1 AraC family transcriptional regulator [Aeromonas salmonicida subsp. salmonicida]
MHRFRKQRPCQQQGGDTDAILMAAGLTPFDIHREHGRILAHSHYRMLGLMQRHLSGFHEGILSYDIAELYQHYPALISLCLNQPSPRAAIEALLAYRTVIGNCDDFVVRRGALFSQYEYINQGPAVLGASQAIPNFVILYRILRVYAPGFGVSVGFVGKPPAHHRQLDHFFGTHCRWDQPGNTLTIDNALLDSRADSYNEPLCRLQTSQLAHICLDIDERVPFANLVADMIRHKIRGGVMESDDHLLKDVCSAMNISRWTLNRKLQGEGSSFSAILKRVKMMEACRLLGEGEQPLQNISDLVGFSSQSAFNRFFKANTNMTPLAYRNTRQ